MKRPGSHTVGKMGKGQMPAACIVVQAASETHYESDADAWGRPVFAGWSAIAMRWDQTRWLASASGAGSMRSEYWDWLVDALNGMQLQGTPQVRIVSINARETMALLGLWDLVDDGNIALTNGQASGSMGRVLLSGPPTVVDYILLTCKGKHVWVDPSNYGAMLWPFPGPWTHHDRIGEMVLACQAWVADYAELLVSFGLGAWEVTAGSQAACGYRRTYMRDRIVTHDNTAVRALERDSLVGGRCEVYRIGEVQGPVYHLDVNSLYASCARDAMLPTELDTMVRYPDPDMVFEAALCIPVIARVLVSTDTPCVPCQLDGRTVYPVGQFWTALTSPEITLLREYGEIRKCHVMACYRGRIIYRAWVDAFTDGIRQARELGNMVQAACLKSLLTASFGKWAQRGKVWTDCPEEICPWPWYQWYEFDRETDTLLCKRSLAGMVQREDCIGETPDSFPAITAFINAYGRVRMWQLLADCGDGAVYYMDTDSLWTNAEESARLEMCGQLHATEAGKLKQVAVHSSVTFAGQKRYIADGELTCVGFDGDTTRIIDGQFRQLKAPPLSYYLHHRQRPGLDRQVARIMLEQPYHYGTVGADGVVHPLRIGERDGDRKLYR